MKTKAKIKPKRKKKQITIGELLFAAGYPPNYLQSNWDTVPVMPEA